MLLVLIALVILVWLLIQTTFVQNIIIDRVTSRLSKDLNTTVQIKHVDFDLFNSMLLEGTLVKDQRNDTLLYAGTAKVLITDWFFFTDKVELKYVGLKEAVVHLERQDSVWNYHFLIDYFSGPKKSKKQSSIDLQLKQLELENVALIQKDGWRGENLSASVHSFNMLADTFDLTNNRILINSIIVDQPSFAIYNYQGKRKSRPVVTQDEEEIINDTAHLRWNSGRWKVDIVKVEMKNGAFKNDVFTERKPETYFDGAHFEFTALNADFRNIRLQNDSITARVKLSTKERSGFQVESLTADMRMHPEAMEFYRLDLRTPKSRLHDFFAMRYRSFDDMGDFISKVRLEGNFIKSEINSDDIAYFAPQLAAWKKEIKVTGRVTGTIENLNGKNLSIEAGLNTYLNGNISIAGLPDIDKTYIDFVANDFRTTYSDVVKLVPAVKSLAQPRLDLLQWIRFKGNFTGFVRDFVTYGRFETPMGNFTTDLNMKIPANGAASYSGNLKTDRFAIGRFLDVPEVGEIGLKGTIVGRGMSVNSMNTKFDGDVSFIEFNNYSYQGIRVKGEFAKKQFNGDLSISDPNLEVVLNGKIDLNKKIPDFDFTAEVAKANLRQLKLMNENIDFDGKFKFDFSGSNIDNFLGTARVYDASVYRNGNRIAFDSLLVESKINDNQKVITAVSNEFDAALAGEFSILQLPNAFKKFLGKYYPSYIKPNLTKATNENFSFVITTKTVDDYLQLFQRKLSGMNNSTISGRINTKENLLDLNAFIPQLYYGNIGITDLDIKAVGTNDSLSLEGNIANVAVNDSMQFPGTHLTIKSSNDISEVALITSGTQTINSANLSAQVQTLPTGAKILFRESSFDLNGKTWIIDKNGQLLLTNQMVGAEGIRLYNGQQEILVSTVPSDIGNTHDIRIDLTKFNLGDISPYLVPDTRIEGMMTGSINIIDPFGKFKVDAETEAELFRLDDDSIGKVALNAHYNRQTGMLNLGAISDNDNYKFNIDGSYKFRDSVSNDNLGININLEDTKIDVLEKYLSGVFSDLTGHATGTLRINGTTKDLSYLGNVQLKNGGMRVKYTNVYYTIPSANFQFLEDRIDFGAFQLKDSLGNSGTVSRGQLFHRGFNDLAFDFVMNTNKLLVLNTTNNGVDPYYGQVIARANLSFKGPLENMEMSISAEPADSSSFFISNKSSKESGQADFVVWKVYGTEMQPVARSKGSNLTVDLDIIANNYAKMYVIMDELTGDVIKAVGSGNLQIHATTSGDLSINGRYDIERGDYNFSFQSLLKKPFKLREGQGNYIVWDGDPFNARMNIDAEYAAENVQFSDLGSGLQTQGQFISNDVRRFRGMVLVIAKLTGPLLSPDIKFSIELPQNSPLKNDQSASVILQSILKDENELNKQVAFLIVFNSFAPLSNSNNQNITNTAFEGIVVSSISGILSNTLSKQFSNIVQGIFNDKSLKVNFNAQLYSGSNYLTDITTNRGIDRTNLNFSIGKSLFNERLTFTFGSAFDFGLSSAQINGAGSIPFLPDITADWKIRPDGKLVLSFFYRETYNYSTPGLGNRQNRSGASISYRRDFDRFSQLWRNEKTKQ